MALIGLALRAVRRLVDLLLVALLLVALGGVVLGKLLPLTGHPTLVIGGRSMDPTLPMGSAVILDQVAPVELVVGDVVSVATEPGASAITHRVTRLVSERGDPLLAIKGDANEAEDPVLVPARSVIGRVVWSIPGAGYLLGLLGAPVGVALLIGLAGALLGCNAVIEALDYRASRPRRGVLRRLRVTRPSLTRPVLAPAWPLPPTDATAPIRSLSGSPGQSLVRVRPSVGGGWVAEQPRDFRREWDAPA
jgi:signal peptidase I